MLSFTEENYLKVLSQILVEKDGSQGAGVNELAMHLGVKPATANDMLKKLKEKKLVTYEKYGKIRLTKEGNQKAMEVVRKHRLWETFLYEKLGFTWDEVHEVAEQLEHIQSAKLIDSLDKFLNFPAFDPHGDAIPNARGELLRQSKKTLTQIATGKTCKMVAVRDNSANFLRYVVQTGLGISSEILVVSRQDYDDMMEIEVEGRRSIVSQKFASNIFVV